MNITLDKSAFEKYLSGINPQFRNRIIKHYFELKERAFKSTFDNSFDASGLSAGKLCEVLFRFLEQELKGTHTLFSKPIGNFLQEAHKLESHTSINSDETLRIMIPRGLVFLYTFRNKRNIGHVAGEIEANLIDINTIERVCDWIICELIRLYHNVTIEEAQEIINAITSKRLPIIWEINGKKRILDTSLSAKEQVLLLCYSQHDNQCLLEDLFSWTEYRNSSDFKTKVLKPLHAQRLIEFDSDMRMIFISPSGIKTVEEEILNSNI